MKRIAFLSAIIFSVLYTNLNFAKSNICPAPIVTNFSPTQGPENTLVTINGSNFNDAASVFFDGISTSFSIINDNVIEAYVPAGISSSSTITITSSGGCTGNAATDFNFLDSQCSTADAYISEIYDALSGSYAVIELYNPTSSPIVLDGVYVIERYGDIGNATPSHTYNVSGTIQPLDTFIIILGSGSNCPSLTADFTVSTGINDNDEFKLLKNGVLIDIVNAPGERGYSIIRNPDAAVSQTTFNGSDWTINSEEDCSDLDSHTADPIPDNTPTITQPNTQTICENGTATYSISISGTETYTYQWMVLNTAGNWVNVTNNANYSGANTSTLTVNNAPTSFDGNQYYCEMTSATCDLVSIAVQLNVNNPQVDTLSDYSDCSSYTLPTLTNGNYFTQANGNGTQLNAGDVISSTQTIYIFNEVGTAPNTCSNESSFTVTISGNPPVDTLADYSDCSSYTLPTLTNGNYFTQANGNGTQLNAGDVISSTQTIYIFNEVGTAPNTCSNESSFTVTISGNPPVDTLADYSDCSSYTLPTLTNGNYFTQANGNGTQLNAGDVISSTQTIYIFNEVGTAPNTCSSESSFTVTISGNPPVDTLADYSDCSSYTLPTLTNGNYFTQANGNGTQLNAGDVISSTQTIYIFNEVGTAPNTCSNESSFTVTISGNPPVDTLADYSDCSSYTLPTLTNGNYFTQANGNGTQLNAGDVISSTQTIYIFNEVGTAPNTCSSESSFTVTISGNPPVDTLADYSDCSSYTLPTLTNGNYFTQANGNGTQLNAGDVISSTQTIYIFNEVGTAPNTCSNESSFTVTISGNPPVDTLADYSDCSSYTLPTLTNGNYFTQANGNGTQLNAGDVISSTQTIYIFNEVGTAPNTCSNESSFTVTISGNPPVDTLADYSDCSSYTLPTLTNGNYFTQANGNGTQLNAGDVISSTQTIYIFNEVGTAPNTCSSESSFTVTISGNPPVDTLADYSDCSSYTLPTLTNGNYFTQANGNGTQLNAGDVISSTQTIYIFNEVGTAPNTCSSESNFTVTIYNSVDFSLNDSNISINDNNLIVNMSNTSISYEYAVDNSNFQTSASFYNLSPGTHTLYVQDSNGCIIKSLNFEIKESNDIHIPLFFTPNFDGQNDVWQITDNKNTIKEIYIFDRYGKLLKQVSPRLKRWDGNYNGYPMETNDYWYLITLKTGEQLNGHFTLKR